MKPFSNNFYIAAVIIAGFILIGYLVANGGAVQVPGVIIAIGVLVKLFNTDAKADTILAVASDTKDEAVKSTTAATGAKTEAVKATAQSVSNGVALIHVGAALEQNSATGESTHQTVETTHTMVNSEKDKREAQIAAQDAKLESLGVQLAAALATIEHERKKAEPSTPPDSGQGTTIAPGGPTTIVIDPGTPVTVVPPTEPQP